MDKQFVTLPEGKRIAYRIYGDGKHDVLMYHGLVGGSAIGGELAEAVQMADVRLIVPERPGYGSSDAFAMQSIADWMPIAEALGEVWELSDADVIGCSAGAPYAYASAIAMPRRVGRLWISSGVPAVYESAVLAHYTEADREAYQRFLTTPQETVQAYYMQQMTAAQAKFAGAGMEHMQETLTEIVAQACYGMAQESRLQMTPWQLPFASIAQTITLQHAWADEMIPVAAVKEMQAMLGSARFSETTVTALSPGESLHIRANAENVLALLRLYPKG